MANNHNFRIKNGLEVGGVEVITENGVMLLPSTSTATTQDGGTNNTRIATTAFVQQEITSLIGGAPGSLNTLNELAAAINDDASYATTLTTALATKLPLAGGTLTGAITAPTLYLNDTNTRLHEGSGNALRITTGTGYIDIGSKNSGWIHFEGNKPYYFNQALSMDADLKPYNTSGARNLGTTSNVWNHVYAKGYFIDSTEVIDASRNLTNIGTISSGVITATGGNSTNWNTAYTYSQVGHLPLAGGTLTGNLIATTANFTGNVVVGNSGASTSFNVGGAYGKKYWTKGYSVSNTAIGELVNQDGTSLATGGAYRFTAHIDGTGTDQSSRAVFWNENGTWNVNVTGQSGTNSNHIQFLVSGGVPSVKTYHASNYTVRVWHERINLNENAGSDNTEHYFGADAYLSKITDTLSLNSPTTVMGTLNINTGELDIAGLRALSKNSNWLYLNGGNEFTSGVYVGSGMQINGTTRVDGSINFAGANSFTGSNVANWNTAYGWGNHASAGYRAASESLYYKPTREASGSYLNLNTATTPGIYRLHSAGNHTGHPTGSGYSFAIILDNSDVHGQLVFDRVDDGRLYIRAKAASSFATSDWNRVWSDADFANNSTNWNTAYTTANAALPKAGGTMTGNLVMDASIQLGGNRRILGGTTHRALEAHTNGTQLQIGEGYGLINLFKTQNAVNELKLYNNRQDLSNVAVSKVSGYNGVETSNMTFYRGSGGSSGYIRFQTKPTNAASLTDQFQIGDSSTVGYGVNVPVGGYRINGTTAIDSNRQIFARGNTQVGEDGTYGNYGVLGFGGITNGYNRVFGRNSTGDGLFLASATGRGVFVRTNGSGSDTFSFTSAGAFQVAGTTVIDSSRNISGQDFKPASGYHYQRSNHHSGHLEGSYNNVAGNGAKSNPIYTIGSSYNPTDNALSNMYGIGYTSTAASFANPAGGSFNWGMYVAADGDARVWLDGSTGDIWSSGDHYVGSSRVFHDTYHPNADVWTTARNHAVTLTGDVTGTATQSVNGSGNKTWTVATTAAATVMKAGTAISTHDWNTYIDGNEASYVGVNNHSGSNRPTGSYAYGMALNFSNSGQGKLQIYTPEQDGSTGGYYYRTGWNTSYRAWHRLFDDEHHPNADVWTTARNHTVTLTGDVTGTATQSVNGSGNKTWSITTAVGNDSHTHSIYLPKAGGAMTGAITTNSTFDGRDVATDGAKLDQIKTGGTLATFGTTSGTGGRIRCTAPFNTNTGHMFQVTVSLYTSYQIRNYVVAGYMYSTTNQWYSSTAIYSGPGTPDIKVGRDSSGKAYISIARGSYTGVRVHSMTRGYYTTVADTQDPWTITENDATENSVTPTTSTTWHSTNDGPGSGLNADLLDDQHGAYYLNYNNFTNTPTIPQGDITGVTAGTGMTGGGTSGTPTLNVIGGSGINANADDIAVDSTVLRTNVNQTVTTGQTLFNSGTNMATGTGNQSRLEVRGSGSGNDAFMSFHVGGDYATYLGLDGGTNRMSIGGWSMGAVSHAIFHEDYHPNADKWTTARTLTLSGDVTGSVSFDGSAAINMTNTVVANDSHTHSIYLPKAGGTMTGTINGRDFKPASGYHYQRSNHHTGHLEGSYNNVGDNSYKSNPIYTIGSSYNPVDASLSNMYGIGYGHSNASFTSFTGQSGWGLYVATAGNARIWLGSDNGVISSTGEHYVGSSRVFHDTYHPNADVWTTARSHVVTLTGDVTGTATQSVNGSGNKTWTISTAVGNDSHYHSQVYIPDTRGAQRAPSYYPDRYVSYDFQNASDTLAGDDTWQVLQTVAKWSSYASSHRQQQIAYTGPQLKHRVATSDSAWGSWKTIWDSSNLVIGNYLPKNANTMTGSAFKLGFHSGSGGTTFAQNHYSMGVDVANGSWSGTNYSDLIIGYHTGIRIGAGYSGIRFYDNSPTTDTNNTGNGDAGEELLMTIGGGGSATSGAHVTVHNNLFVNDNLYLGDGNDGYFYSDTNGRTAFTGGDFYIQSAVGNCYLYATNTYLGNSSGDNIRFRANTVIADSWGITPAGAATFAGVTSNVTGNVTGSSGSCTGNAATVTQNHSDGGGNYPILWRSSGTTYYTDEVYITASTNTVRAFNYAVTAGGNNGLKFWNGSSSYAICMGNNQNNHGTVTDYSIHHNMDTTAGRGFTFGPSRAGVTCSINAITGAILSNNNITAYSDIRIKDNIEVIPNALHKVSQLSGYTFTRTDVEDKEERYTGVIAQEVLKVLPEAVQLGATEEDTMSVAYGNMVGLMIEAIKELKSEVDDLKTQLSQKGK